MKKRILFVIPSLTQANGIPAFLINYMKNMDLTKFDITILSSNLRPSPDYMNFFRERDIKCFFINDLRKDGFVKYYKSLKNFFKENHKFDLIYSNIANQSLFIFYVAKKYGIKKYAIHSHATMSSSNKLKMIINNKPIRQKCCFTYKFLLGTFSCVFMCVCMFVCVCVCV